MGRSSGPSGHDPAAAPASVAAERAIRLTILVWSALWLLFLLALLIRDPTSTAAPGVSLALLVAVAGLLVALAVTRSPLMIPLVVALALSAAVQAWLTPIDALTGNYPLAVPWTNLAAISAGFALPGRRGRLAVVAIAATELLLLTTDAAAAGVLGASWRTVLAAFSYALVDGMAAHIAAMALRRTAVAADTAAAQLSIRDRAAAARAAHRGEVLRVTRVLHDTVVNTLGAIRRGVPGTDPAAIRERCRADLADLTRLTDSGGPATDAAAIARALGDRGAALGLDVIAHLDVPPDGVVEVPGEVAEALLGAGYESLLNVHKHAGTTRVVVTVTGTVAVASGPDADGGASGPDTGGTTPGTGTAITVVIHDDGQGWDGRPVTGGGVAESILRRAQVAGLRARVTSRPGGGTTVALAWPFEATADHAAPARGHRPSPATAVATADRTSPGTGDPVARSLAEIVVRAGAWLGGLCVVMTGLFWTEVPPGPSLLALAVLAGMLLVSWEYGLRRERVPLPLPVTLGLLVAIAVVAALPARTAQGCVAVGDAWWGPHAAVVGLLAVVLLTRAWWVPFAGSAAYAAGIATLYWRTPPLPAGCAGTPLRILAFDLAIVVAVVLFRRALLRLWGRAERLRVELQDLAMAESVAAARERARDARLTGVVATTAPLLQGLADGGLDPWDPAVRERCGAEETALRALLVIGAELGWVGDALAAAVLHAHAGGRRLDVTAAGAGPRPPDAARAVLPDVLPVIVDRVPVGVAATAAILNDGDGASLTLVAPIHRDLLTAAEQGRLTAVGIAAEQAHVDGETLVELRWTR